MLLVHVERREVLREGFPLVLSSRKVISQTHESQSRLEGSFCVA